MLWVTIGMCCHNVPRPPDALKCSTLGLLNITVILTVTVPDKRPPSRFMCVLVRHHRASRMPSLFALSVAFTLTTSPHTPEGPTGLDRQHHSQGEPTNIRPLLQTKDALCLLANTRNSAVPWQLFSKILFFFFFDQRLCLVLFSRGRLEGKSHVVRGKSAGMQTC